MVERLKDSKTQRLISRNIDQKVEKSAIKLKNQIRNE